MSFLYRALVRPLLFAMDPEEAHDFTLRALGRAGRHPTLCEALAALFAPPPLPIRVFGLDFPNPLGVAAGLDKQAAAVPAWAALGFGFAELGGVTRHPQPGNPVPRLFRIPSEDALINRMGFNNPGAEALASTLQGWRDHGRWPAHPVGVNLGKSKITPLGEAADDYAWSFERLWGLADFFVINVSSPNTPNLRQLQDKHALEQIARRLQTINKAQAGRAGTAAKPLLVKVAPDLSLQALDEVIALARAESLAGIVATNTTVTRPETREPAAQAAYREEGGLSGRPLRRRSTEVIRHIYRQAGGALPIIGVGGIFTAEDAWEKLTAGASLVQIYTGLIYEGPGLVKRVVRGLREKLSAVGVRSLAEIIGTA